MLGFRRFVTARRTLAGVEALAMLGKGRVRAFVHRVFGVAA
jgi:hypothetical protein